MSNERKDAPRVTIVMPALNAELTVGVAVASIRAQTLPDWELIFIDDGSVDQTRQIVESFADPRIRMLHGIKREGVSARLNQGIAQARGRYIARLDADDIAYPERLERQVAFLDSHPEIDVVGSATMVFSDRLGSVGVFRVPEHHQDIVARPEFGFALAAPTWLGRRAWFGVDPYWATAIRGEDQGLLLRRAQTSRYANLSDILVGYRQNLPRIDHILRGRWDYLRQLVAVSLANRQLNLALAGIGTQLTLGAVGVGLVAAGQGEALLRRRFSSPTQEELEHWRIVRRDAHELAQVTVQQD